MPRRSSTKLTSAEREWLIADETLWQRAHAIVALVLEPSERAFLEALGLEVHVLPLARILKSKQAANRPKDRAPIPALEAALAVERDSER